jgi:hypothetical protein
MSSTLSFDQCIESPCTGCTAPCCQFLPLHDFVIQRFQDVDYARYLLNFENIELALVSGTTWRVHYTAPCSRLSPTGGCTLHNSPEKPQVCLNYDAYDCFYRPMFLDSETPNFLRFDGVRFEAFVSMLEFDSKGMLLSLPSSEILKDRLPEFVEHPFQKIAIPKPILLKNPLNSFRDVQRQCEGCAAWCCQTLSFPFAGIEAVSNLDYIWFCLGFPGVELCITETSMSIFVHSRCRNLKSTTQGGCSIFGKPNRPLVCQRYDGMNCAYKVQVGTIDPESSVRISVSEFEALQGQFHFDAEGQITKALDFSMLRDAIQR